MKQPQTMTDAGRAALAVSERPVGVVSRVTAISSGGQTGADRGGLDAAIHLDLCWGGWAPKGWRSEDGSIPEIYRKHMYELASSSYPVRTERNVMESEGTLILSLGQLAAGSGSRLTASIARRRGKPCRHEIIQSDGLIHGVALVRVREWLNESRIYVLNVAGPRESTEPGIQAAAKAALLSILTGR